MQLFLLFATSYSWCPYLHQSITRQFSYEYYPYITDAQREAFITGSIYADGVDKSLTHNVVLLREKMSQLDRESELYWFFMGNFAHITSDVFAHAGKSMSFIVPHGLKHHLSELIIDSLIVSKYNPPYVTISSTLTKSLDDMGIKFVTSFRFLYPLIRILTKLPLFKLLPKIQSDQCPVRDLDLSICNFMNHYEMMLECMRLSFPRIDEPSFNDLRVKETSVSLIFDIRCCQDNSINLTLDDNEDNYYNENPTYVYPVFTQVSV